MDSDRTLVCARICLLLAPGNTNMENASYTAVSRRDSFISIPFGVNNGVMVASQLNAQDSCERREQTKEALQSASTAAQVVRPQESQKPTCHIWRRWTNAGGYQYPITNGGPQRKGFPYETSGSWIRWTISVLLQWRWQSVKVKVNKTLGVLQTTDSKGMK